VAILLKECPVHKPPVVPREVRLRGMRVRLTAAATTKSLEARTAHTKAMRQHAGEITARGRFAEHGDIALVVGVLQVGT